MYFQMRVVVETTYGEIVKDTITVKAKSVERAEVKIKNHMKRVFGQLSKLVVSQPHEKFSAPSESEQFLLARNYIRRSRQYC